MSGPAADRAYAGIVHREIVLLTILAGIAVAAFFGTRELAGSDRAWRLRDARTWYRRGLEQTAAGRTVEAVRDLRKAAVMDRNNRAYRLALASALANANDDDGARQVLARLREESPEDAEISLQLARLSGRQGDVDAAIRFYRGAVYGFWGGDPAEPIRHARVELIRFLLAHGQSSGALSELLLLASSLPEEPTAHIEAAHLFLDAGDARRALDHFVRALGLNPASAEAAGGAGEAAFAIGDYPAATEYLAKAPQTDRVTELREVLESVRTGDPLAPRLRLADRQARLVTDLAQASRRLDACRSQTGAAANAAALESLAAEASALQPAIDTASLQRSPETIDDAVALMFRMESAASAQCGKGTPLDQALVLIAHRHELDHP